MVAVVVVVVVVAFSKLVGGTYTAPLGNKEPEDIDLQGNPVHYTNGGPWFKDWQNVEYAQEWIRRAGAIDPGFQPV